MFDGGEVGEIGVEGGCSGGGSAPGEDVGDLLWCFGMGGEGACVFEAGHESEDVVPAFDEIEDGWWCFVVGSGVGQFVFEIEICADGVCGMRVRPCF